MPTDACNAAKRPGRPQHQPTQELRRAVEQHVAIGTTQAQIAQLIGVAFNTLKRHYAAELELGLARANAVVASALFAAARRGNIRAAIFWLRTRGGWKETTRLAVGGDAEAPPIRVQIDPKLLRDDTLDDLMAARDRSLGRTH